MRRQKQGCLKPKWKLYTYSLEGQAMESMMAYLQQEGTYVSHTLTHQTFISLRYGNMILPCVCCFPLSAVVWHTWSDQPERFSNSRAFGTKSWLFSHPTDGVATSIVSCLVVLETESRFTGPHRATIYVAIKKCCISCQIIMGFRLL